MAYTKVSDLTALTSPDGAEELLVNDGGTSKKITIANATASKLNLSGGTLTGDLNLGDNVDINFGDSADLKIYHDGSHSYVKDAGDGQLRLVAGTNVQIWNSGETNMAANFNGDSQSSINYAGAIKLTTTNTGIDVTGSVITSDKVRIVNDTASKVEFGDSGDASIGKIEYTHSSDSLYFKVNNEERMRIDSSGNVGIGGSPTAGILHTIGTGNQAIRFECTDNNHVRLELDADRSSGSVLASFDGLWDGTTVTRIQTLSGANDESDADLTFHTKGNTDGAPIERMRIDSDGNVGIGCTPSTLTHIKASSGAILRVEETGGSYGELEAGGSGFHINAKSGGYITLRPNGNTEAMRIDSSGNVGIGDTDPSEAKLSIDNVAAGDIGLQIVQAQDEYGLYIDQNGDAEALKIDSEATSYNVIQSNGKYGIRSNQDISGGYAIYAYRNIDEAGSYPLLRITDDHTSNTQPALKVIQNGAGYGLYIDQNGDKQAIYIDSEATTKDGILVQCDALTTGYAGHFYSNSADTSTRNLVNIKNDNAAATGTTALKVTQDSTGAAAVFEGGNVGIGTSSPDAELDVSAAQSPFIRLSSEKDGTHNGGDVYGGIHFHTADAGYDGPIVGAKIQAEHTRAGTGLTSADMGLVFYTSEGSQDIAGVERLSIESGSGDVEVKTGNLVIGTSGKGIDFSATADGTTMSSELLDDYEEGAWTPVIVGGTLTRDSVESANYVKIGKFVYIDCYIRTDTADGDTTHMQISGLPYAAQKYGTGASINKGNTGGTEIENPHFRFSPDSTTIYFFKNFKQTNMVQSDIHGDHIIFSATYSTTS